VALPRPAACDVSLSRHKLIFRNASKNCGLSDRNKSWGFEFGLVMMSQCRVADMSDDSKRTEHHKSELSEPLTTNVHHRVVRRAIGRGLRATYRVSRELPHRMLTLLMQLNAKLGPKKR